VDWENALIFEAGDGWLVNATVLDITVIEQKESTVHHIACVYIYIYIYF
jgi:hypothetical protein